MPLHPSRSFFLSVLQSCVEEEGTMSGVSVSTRWKVRGVNNCLRKSTMGLLGYKMMVKGEKIDVCH